MSEEDKKSKKTSPVSGRLSWFEKLIPARISARSSVDEKGNVPEGLWVKCDNCANVLYRAEVERAQDVCIKCAHHMRISARTRIDRLLDPDGRIEIGDGIEPVDMLKFKDSKRYRDRLTQKYKDTGENDALVVMRGTILGNALVVAVFDFNFMGGSMGSVVGERFSRACDQCLQDEIHWFALVPVAAQECKRLCFRYFKWEKPAPC